MSNHHLAVKLIASESLKTPVPSQKIRLLEYLLKNGRIASPLVAWQELGCYRLSDCIYKLRKQGIDIITEIVTIHNQFGEKCEVASYRLAEWQPNLKVVKP